MELVLATRNEGKVREMRSMLDGLGIQLINQSDTDIPSPVEDGGTFVENALIKARAVSRATGLPCIADDSGLVVPSLGGAPGIFSARYAGANATDDENNAQLLKALTDGKDRSAYFYCCMVFLTHADDPTPLIATGQWQGEILQQPAGLEGFGYDPLFFVPELGKSAAELTKTTKNKISHRGQACAALLGSLQARRASTR